MKRLSKKTLLKWLPVIFVAVVSLVPLVWFYGRSGVLIDGVDTNFPLDPVVWFLRRFYVWNEGLNGGANFASSTAGWFFHLVQALPFWAGVGLQGVQIISLVFWFGLVTLGAWLLAREMFPRQGVVQMVFVSLYALNIYLFNTWENVKVANLALVAAIPLVLVILIKMREKVWDFWQGVALASGVGVVLNGAGINPAYFMSFFVLTVMFLVGQMVEERSREGVGRVAKNWAGVAGVIVLVNLFWLLPTARFVSSSVPGNYSLEALGFTNWLNSLSENTSLFNVMRMQGAWDWYAVEGKTGLPLYIPYALNYFRKLPFLLFSWGIPAIVVLSLVWRDERRKGWYLSFGVMMVVGVFLGAGTHEPTGGFFMWLVSRVPFFSLFRSPWYIFTPLVILATAGLCGLLFSRWWGEGRGVGKRRMWAILAVGVLVAGNFLYCYPLVTGKIFRPDRTDGFFVKFPSYIFDSAIWLASQREGRVIGYPGDEIEQFRWGYRGVESVLQLVTDRPVLFSPLNATESPMAQAVRQFYGDLEKKKVDAAANLAAKLDLVWVLEKQDQASLALDLPERLVSEWGKQSWGEWNFYQVPEEKIYGKVYAAGGIYRGFPADEKAGMLDAEGGRGIIVDPRDSVVNAEEFPCATVGDVILAKNWQQTELDDFISSPARLADRMTSRDLSRVRFSFEVDREGEYQPILEKYRLADFGMNVKEGMEVEVDGGKQWWTLAEETDSYLYFNPVRWTKGSHEVTWGLRNEDLLTGKGDFEGEVASEGGQIVLGGEKGRRWVEVLNREGAAEAVVKFGLSGFDPLGSYLVNLKYRQIYGDNALLKIYQRHGKGLVKIQVERMPNYPDWADFSFYFQPVKTDSEVEMDLVASPVDDPMGTKVLYDNLTVQRVFTNQLILWGRMGKEAEEVSTVKTERLSPVRYSGEVRGKGGLATLVFAENYSPGWEMTVEDEKGRQLPVRQWHFSANAFANAWCLAETPENYRFEIYYKPQNWLMWGGIVSGGTFLASLSYLLWRKVKKS